ncbi:MAG: hypothetical protein OXH28_06625 [bacterium]|nr:hypothetical protein [bacterium]
MPWRPSDDHITLLRQLPRPNAKQLGAETLAKTIGMSRRKVTVMLHDLRAAHLVHCYKTIKDDLRLQITVWRRSPYGERWLLSLLTPPRPGDNTVAQARRRV